MADIGVMQIGIPGAEVGFERIEIRLERFCHE